MGKHVIPGLGLTITAPAALTPEQMMPVFVGTLELLQYDKGPIMNTCKTWEASLGAIKAAEKQQQSTTGKKKEAPCLVALAMEVQVFASVMIIPDANKDLRRMVEEKEEYDAPFEAWELRFFELVKAFTDFDFPRCIDLGADALYQEPADIFSFRVFFLVCFFTGEYNVLADVMSFVLSALRKVPASDCLALPYIQAATAFALEESGGAGGNIDKSVGGSLWEMVIESLEMVSKYNVEKLLGVSDWAHPYAVHTLFHITCNDPNNAVAKIALDKYEPLWVNSLHLAVHLWWHKALIAIENGDHKTALQIYDTKMDKHIVQGDQYALSDASSLLARTYIDGVITSKDIRISPLAAKWAANATNKVIGSIPFFYTNMAALLPLLKNSDECREAAGTILQSLMDISNSTAGKSNKDASVLINAFVDPTPETLSAAWRQGSRTRWASTGGSLAQRELFQRYLLTHSQFPYGPQVLAGEALKHPKQVWIQQRLL